MLIIYSSPGCGSCRKAKQYMKDHDIPFTEKNIFSTMLNEKEIRFLLERSENGSDDIVSKRSKIIKELGVNVEDMSTNELVRFIQANPSVMKRPIIMDEKRFMVGYDEDEITAFVPGHLNNIVNTGCTLECPNFTVCGRLRGEE